MQHPACTSINCTACSLRSNNNVGHLLQGFNMAVQDAGMQLPATPSKLDTLLQQRIDGQLKVINKSSCIINHHHERYGCLEGLIKRSQSDMHVAHS